MGYQLIETIEVGSGGGSSIVFTGIPQDGVDLLLTLSTRSTSANVIAPCRILLNTEFGFVYNFKFLKGSGSAASSSGSTGGNGFIDFNQPGANATANTFSNSSFYFSNYTSATSKSVSANIVTENNATAAEQMIYAGQVPLSAGINRVQILDQTANPFAQYSTFSIYKITAD
jgi:hypothetical protein